MVTTDITAEHLEAYQTTARQAGTVFTGNAIVRVSHPSHSPVVRTDSSVNFTRIVGYATIPFLRQSG